MPSRHVRLTYKVIRYPYVTSRISNIRPRACTITITRTSRFNTFEASTGALNSSKMQVLARQECIVVEMLTGQGWLG